MLRQASQLELMLRSHMGESRANLLANGKFDNSHVICCDP